MKARFVSKAALCVSALMVATAIPAMAQQPASPAAPAAADSVKMTKKEKSLVQKMDALVQKAKKAGVLDMKAVSAVLDKAAKTPVSDAVMGKLVSMAAGVSPADAPQVAAAAVKAYGANVTKAQVQNVVNSAVSVQPQPFASVEPVCAAVKQALADSPVAADMSAIAIATAQTTPDNPLPAGAVDTPKGGTLVDPEGGDPVGTLPQPVSPVSNPVSE